jgi:hypothetical protein
MKTWGQFVARRSWAVLLGGLAVVWRGYVHLDDARDCARSALRDARVLGVAIVDDHNGPLSLVEWMTPETQPRIVTEGPVARSVVETMQRAAASGARRRS